MDACSLTSSYVASLMFTCLTTTALPKDRDEDAPTSRDEDDPAGAGQVATARVHRIAPPFSSKASRVSKAVFNCRSASTWAFNSCTAFTNGITKAS